MKPTAIIIGAGYSGMALANLLAKSGYSVRVYEKNTESGGRIAAVTQNGYTFDIGPSWYLMPEVFEQYYELFDESATQRLDLIRFDPGYRVFFEHDTPLTIHGDLEKDIPTFESIEVGAGAKLRNYIETSTRAYELSVQYFLYNNFQRLRDIFHWQVIKNAPRMLRLIRQPLDRYVSSVFKSRRLKQLLEYHMVFLGSSPFQAPAIYTLMSHLDFVSGVFYPRRGMMSLVDDMKSLGEKLDISYNFNTAVQRIIVEDGTAVGILLEDGQEVHADIVVSAADLHHTETALLESKHQSFPQSYWDKRQPGPGALLVSLGVRGELPQLSHHNLFFVDEWRENFKAIYEYKTIPEHASIYVCNPSKTDPSLAPPQHENLFFLVPIPAGVELTEAEETELANKSIDTFARAAGIDDLTDRISETHIFGPKDFAARYNAWEFNAFGGESHLLRQSILFRTPPVSRKVKNLYYVGAGTIPGIGLPMCLIGAQLTFKRITKNHSAGPLNKEDL